MPYRHMLMPVILAALPLAACTEQETYPLSVDGIKNKLSGKVATYYYKDNKVLMRFERGAGDSVSVTLRGQYWIQKCTLLLEAVDQASTRLATDCGKSDNEYRQKTLDAKKPMVAEKAREILTKEQF